VTVMKGATLSKPPSTGSRGIQFLNAPSYIRSRNTRRYR